MGNSFLVWRWTGDSLLVLSFLQILWQEPGYLSGTELGYGLDDWGFESREELRISLHHRIQTSSGAHLASYPTATRGSFSGGKADHSHPASAEVKKAWNYTATPPIRLHDAVLGKEKRRGNFTFTFTHIIQPSGTQTNGFCVIMHLSWNKISRYVIASVFL
jgi:hypothetical protein